MHEFGESGNRRLCYPFLWQQHLGGPSLVHISLSLRISYEPVESLIDSGHLKKNVFPAYLAFQGITVSFSSQLLEDISQI